MIFLWIFKEVFTSDGQRMLFYTMNEGTDINGKPTYDFAGFIDYVKDKGVIVEVHLKRLPMDR